ncbi:MAG: hypothetical protein ABI867_42705 [Kofleriaceae bacterium]
MRNFSKLGVALVWVALVPACGSKKKELGDKTAACTKIYTEYRSQQDKKVWMDACAAAPDENVRCLSLIMEEGKDDACMKLSNSEARTALVMLFKGKPDTAAPPAAAPKPVGILAPDNDPDIVAAAKTVLAECATKWKAKSGWGSCSALDKLHDLKPKVPGDRDATLVNLAEDPDEKVRAIAADGLLYIGGGRYEHDEGLATRLVAALEKETCVSIDGRMARHVAKIDVAKVPLADRIKKLALAPATTNDIKVFLGAWWGSDTSKDNAAAYETSKTLATTATDNRVRRSAMMGLSTFYTGHEEELCQIWNAAIADSDLETSRTAMQLVCGSSSIFTSDEDAPGGDSAGGVRSSEIKCAQADAVVDAIAAKAKAGTINHSDYVYALDAASSGDKPTPLRTKALAVLKAVVENKANGYERPRALERLVSLDKTQKPYAQKWARDKDLEDTVKRINDRK